MIYLNRPRQPFVSRRKFINGPAFGVDSKVNELSTKFDIVIGVTPEDQK